jgi:hypothetical protein
LWVALLRFNAMLIVNTEREGGVKG